MVNYCKAKFAMMLVAASSLFVIGTCGAEIAQVDLSAVEPRPLIPAEQFHMGTATAPNGHTISVNSVSLLRDGEIWTPMMGEFHYSRYPRSQWREELLKMKAGGVEIVSTYVFWIHHEEVEGEWEWSGQRDLHRFVSLCGELGLYSVVRIGPWDHGEVRNGGIPDWLLTKGYKLRSDDPGYLAEVNKLYEAIAAQLKGLLWKDGGPVIGVQVENEYRGRQEHLLHIKELAVKAGFDVPLYTRTGWPELRPAPAFGELVPMYGGYAEGFWDKALTAMPGNYWQAFIFTAMRDTMEAPAKVDARYPFLTCELGGGMETSYHRRILVDPRDPAALELVKLGLGSNLAGFYMYHGGTNPPGGLSTLNENQATKLTNDNDMPVKNYDFQAALGAYGEIRPQYHLLRRMEMFLRNWGPIMAPMEPVIPKALPGRKNDTSVLRYSIRSDGKSGFIFVNNYQRLTPMPSKEGTQFQLKLVGGQLSIPQLPVTVPANSFFVWPFNLDVGGVTLVYATAQPVCQVADAGTEYTLFAQTTGVPTEFVFDAAATVTATTGAATTAEGRIVVKDVMPGPGAAVELQTREGKKSAIILLDEATSLAVWKGHFAGRDCVMLTHAGLTIDNDKLRLQSTDPGDLSVSILPAPASMALVDGKLTEAQDGLFRKFSASINVHPLAQATLEQVQPVGVPREIPIAAKRGGVAEEPGEEDFAAAAVWRVKLPQGMATDRQMMLGLHYVGDVARFYLDGKFIDDNFYNGNEFDLGLRRFASDIYQKELLLKILPLQKGAPIYVPTEAMPDFGGNSMAVGIKRCDLIETLSVEMSAK
ncbi:MAG: beta-galactosidase [Planctomycetota bacterium]|nr:beta-galactosidase [Planctomycetota bacterium]